MNHPLAHNAIQNTPTMMAYNSFAPNVGMNGKNPLLPTTKTPYTLKMPMAQP